MILQSVYFLHAELVRAFHYEGQFQIQSFKFQHVLSWECGSVVEDLHSV